MPVLDRKWWTLIAVCTATFMLLLDITVVNVALPDIQRSLHSSFSDLQWVVDAYSLTLAAFLLTAGVSGTCTAAEPSSPVGSSSSASSWSVASPPPRRCSTSRGRSSSRRCYHVRHVGGLIASAFHGPQRAPLGIPAPSSARKSPSDH